ncbi:hypothetical protein [Streptomyces bottropensis]|uniref:hypothetical protein n=1 Tax=Streptomyces bottropensis TaxID=42235 RepID=UPI0036AD7D72
MEQTVNLEELITALEATDPNRIVACGFSNPHSYRGDYMDLAFEPATDISVGEMLDAARSALGATFQGWKGGEFTMGGHTWCWLSQEGDASGETISALLVELLLDGPAVSVVPPATNQAALREQVAEALRRAPFEELRADWTAPNGPLKITARIDDLADAVLAVLPAPVDRAAVLTEAATRYEEILAKADTGRDPRYWTAVRALTLGLRAMADGERPEGDDTVHACPGRWGGPACTCFDSNEAQPAVAPCVAAEAPHTVAPDALPFTHLDDDGDQLEIGAVMASTYDGEAPVVYVATEQHQGDQVATVYVRPERVERVIAALRSARRAAETLPAVVAQPGKENDRG